jgi:integrase
MKKVEPIKDQKMIKNMRAILKNQSLRNEFLFVLGINIGLRISDNLKLKIEDLIKPNSKTARDYVTIQEVKTGKTKKFYLGDIVKKTIESYIKETPGVIPDDYVFKSRKGNNIPITRQRAYKIINNAAEDLGIVERNSKGIIVSGEIGTHTMRKTFGYHAYKNGVSLELLMDIFNHSTPAMTLRYIGITERQKQEVYLQSNLG